MTLKDVKHWVFDMDGTLTVAVHDFKLIHRELSIPDDEDILTHLAGLPAAESAAKHAWLLEHERELALASTPAPGAVELILDLAERGVRLGILTRNAQELAQITLKAIGLDQCFAPDDVLGRDNAAHKPDPDGLFKLAKAWGVEPTQMVMVGDFRFDLECGRAAGSKTVLVNVPENPWPGLADWHARDCFELRRLVA